MKKVVLFDMDGVIVNTEDKHYQAWKKALELEGISLSKNIYKEQIQSQGRKQAIRNVVLDPSQEVEDRINKNKSMFYEEYINQGIKVYGDAFTLIKRLANTDITLGVVSSSSYALYVLDKINLKDYFSIIISGTKDLNIKNKPAADIYNYAIKKLSCQKEDVLIIEDSLTGIQAGLEAACTVVGVQREKIHIKDEHLVLVKTLDHETISHIIK